ncbi:hypothetical protein ACTXT7_014271 [Hymenolepis weldensis]
MAPFFLPQQVVGCALGFGLPPLMVPSPTGPSEDFSDYLVGFRILFILIEKIGFEVAMETLHFRFYKRESSSPANSSKTLTCEAFNCMKMFTE